MLDGTQYYNAGGLLSNIGSGEKVCIKFGLEITDYMDRYFDLQGTETVGETVGKITYNVFM